MTLTMESTSAERIVEIREKQRKYFHSGATLDVKARKAALKKFEQAVLKWEKPLCDALWADLHKSYEEAYLTEISILLGEIRTHIRKIGKWTRPQRKCTPLKLFPSSSRIVSEPLGTALIISPWNYPVQLLLTPLVGAISAGCTAVLKPSPYVPTVSKVIEDMICDTFPEEYVAVTQGHRDVNGLLLEQCWDMIFFTGSPSLGRLVMASAAKNLTPVVLELGGKSPCIIDKDADIRTAAKRVAWGKSLNAGQTCVAPDYLLIERGVKGRFLEYFKKEVLDFFPNSDFSDMPVIVNDKHFKRLMDTIDASKAKGAKVFMGGNGDMNSRFIEPTVLDDVSWDSPVMEQEIFGPILPVIEYEDLDSVLNAIKQRPRPLALYLFSNDKAVQCKVLSSVSYGGGCVNDTIIHLATPYMGFGGVGESGMGSYHGKRSFDTFTHYKSIVKKSNVIDLPMRYHPYSKKKLSFIKKVMK